MKLSRKISVALLSLALLSGVAVGAGQSSAQASHIKTVSIKKSNVKNQQRGQNQSGLVHKVNRKAQNNRKAKKNNWFVDGLNHRNLAARSWVTYRESGHHWNVRGGRCVGYFQLSPRYLGYKHGRVNLNHRHQVKVGDAYAASRYGSWVGAKSFWQAHRWY